MCTCVLLSVDNLAGQKPPHPRQLPPPCLSLLCFKFLAVLRPGFRAACRRESTETTHLSTQSQQECIIVSFRKSVDRWFITMCVVILIQPFIQRLYLELKQHCISHSLSHYAHYSLRRPSWFSQSLNSTSDLYTILRIHCRHAIIVLNRIAQLYSSPLSSSVLYLQTL